MSEEKRRRGAAAAAALLLACVTGLQGAAAAGRLPAPVAKASAALREQCRQNGGKPQGDGVVGSADLNGDGIVDHVLAGMAVGCEGAESAMGPAQVVGAAYEVWVGQPGGGAMRAFEGQAWEIQVDRAATPPRVVVDVAGRDCGQRNVDKLPVAAIEHCQRALVWQAGSGKFVLGPKVTAGAAAAAPAAVPAPQAPPPECAGQPCAFDRHVLAHATDVRTSLQGSAHYVTLNVALRNQSAAPLTLAVMPETADLADDQGGRYKMTAQIRGIGIVSGRNVDASLTLAPGESVATRFEFHWMGQAGQVRGTRFTLQFSLRELQPLPGQQVKLGREHALVLRNLADRAEVATAPAPAASAAPLRNLCEGRPRCADMHAFSGEVVRATVTACQVNPYYLILQATVRLRNASDQPIVLAYPTGGVSATDNLGARWVAANLCSAPQVQGMGLVDRGSVDGSFVLAPGESRDAIFGLTYSKTEASQPRGTTFNLDLLLEQYAPLPGQQVKLVRQHSLSFNDLTEVGAPKGGVAAAAGAAPASAGTKAVKDLIDAFKGKKKP